MSPRSFGVVWNANLEEEEKRAGTPVSKVCMKHVDDRREHFPPQTCSFVFSFLFCCCYLHLCATSGVVYNESGSVTCTHVCPTPSIFSLLTQRTAVSIQQLKAKMDAPYAPVAKKLPEAAAAADGGVLFDGGPGDMSKGEFAEWWAAKKASEGLPPSPEVVAAAAPAPPAAPPAAAAGGAAAAVPLEAQIVLASAADMTDGMWQLVKLADLAFAIALATDSATASCVDTEEKVLRITARAMRLWRRNPGSAALLAFASCWKAKSALATTNARLARDAQRRRTINFAASFVTDARATSDAGMCSGVNQVAGFAAAGIEPPASGSTPSLAVTAGQTTLNDVLANKTIDVECSVGVGMNQTTCDSAMTGKPTVAAYSFLSMTNGKSVLRSVAIEAVLNKKVKGAYGPHPLRTAVLHGAQVAMSFEDAFGCVHIKLLVLN